MRSFSFLTEKKLLIDEEPLQVLPSLAKAIGLNDALFLQQLHYWLRKSKHEHDGRVWIYNTFEEWKNQFPFWSLDTMQRIAKRLVEKELIYVRQFTKADWDRKNWYAINYEKLEEHSAALVSRNLRPSRKPQVAALDEGKLRSSLKDQETTTENTQEIIHPPFHGDEFLTTLADFEEHRKEIRKPLKPTGRRQLYSQLAGLGESRSVAALRYSMAQGWTGVFEEHKNGTSSGNRDASERNADRLRANLAITAELRGDDIGDNF